MSEAYFLLLSERIYYVHYLTLVRSKHVGEYEDEYDGEYEGEYGCVGQSRISVCYIKLPKNRGAICTSCEMIR